MNFLLFFVGLYISFFLFLILPTKWLKIEKINYNIGLNKKILQISDLHMEKLRISPEQLRKVIKKEKPDYIFYTGDYMDREYSFDKLNHYFKELAKEEIVSYAVLGNHDYYLKEENTKKLVDILKKNNVKVLRNENVELDNFTIIGIDDYGSEMHEIEKSFENLMDKNKKIVITHDPNVVEEIKVNYHYLMSGHLHGKQINVPFLFRFKDMGSIPNNGVWKGLNHTEYGPYYISKGIGQSKFNIRFMVRSEVTIHYL